MFTRVFMVHENAGGRDRIAQQIADEIVRIGPDDTPSTTALLERVAGQAADGPVQMVKRRGMTGGDSERSAAG